jgi:hypothetical protein
MVTSCLLRIGQWTYSLMNNILISTSLDKMFAKAWKSITKLVIFQSFVAKCCKMRIIYSPAKFAVFQSFCIINWYRFLKKGINFPCVMTKWLKNGKLRRAVLSTFYNISQRNIGIFLILWCSFKAVMKFLSRSKFCLLGNRSIAPKPNMIGAYKYRSLSIKQEVIKFSNNSAIRVSKWNSRIF